MRESSHRLGVVIPARDEAERIAACLLSLQQFSEAGDSVLVVDACSSDETARLAVEIGVPVLKSPLPDRSAAIHAGVQRLLNAREALDAILIAHADMRFPPGARATLLEGLRNHPNAPGGAFGHKIDHPAWRFRLIEWGNAIRAKMLQLPYGDQAQFFRPAFLEQAGGFPQQNCLEDLELALRLRSLGRLLYLDHPVTIPPRHWNAGCARTTLRNWLTAARYIMERRAVSTGENRSLV